MRRSSGTSVSRRRRRGGAARLSPAAVAFEEFVDEAGGLQFVQQDEACAEALVGESVDVLAGEAVLGDDLQDEVALLRRTAPAGIGGAGGALSTVGRRRAS